MHLADRISHASRTRKLELLLDTFRPSADTRVVDVGVTDAGWGEDPRCATTNFFEERYPWPERITAVGQGAGEAFRARYPHIPYVQGDGCALPFADGAFDLYVSNAVVEHVGDEAEQRRFVHEAVRVAASVFLTTPNRWFPLEVHTRLPLVHWLPPAAAGRAYDVAGKPWAREVRPLGPAALRRLFPSGTDVRIVNLGLTLVALAGRGARR